MTKSPFTAVLIAFVFFFPSVSSVYAGDASDTMGAALQDQVAAKTQPAAATEPSAAPFVASQPTASSEAIAPVPVKPSASEPVKARDVLTNEEKNTAASVDAGDESLESEKAVPDKGAALEAAATEGKLVLADFNSGDKPNNLGGDFGQWDKDPADDTQSCRMTYASDDVNGDLEGFAMRLDYDVDSPNPSYNGFWMKLENVNATPYDTLSFYVRGVSKKFTKRLKVELKTPAPHQAEYFVSGITNEWQKIEIPLKRFKGIRDWSVLSEFILVFDDINTTPKKGTLLVDQIMLERLEGGMKPPIKSGSPNYVVSNNSAPAEVVTPG